MGIFLKFIARVRCCGGLEKMIENPVMTFPIKKRINTELFIERRAEIYMQNGRQTFLTE